MNILDESFALRAQVTALRRRLHACPETGFDLSRTRAVITEELDRLSIPYSIVGKGAVTATLGEGTEQFILLRADCDGLALREQTGLPFAAQNGNMHACGHDLHTAILLGAAALLKKREGRLSRPVRLLFQPAEELLAGAADALSAGVCEGVREAYMIHTVLGSGIRTGTVLIPPEGVSAPSADFFEVEFRGKGCHGADPSSGIDPLVPAAQLVLALEHLPAREFPPDTRAALTVGALQGGASHNVIPDSASVKGSFRCFDEEFRAFLRRRVEEICAGIGQAGRVKTALSFPAGCPSLYNDPALRKEAVGLLQRTLGNRAYPLSLRSSAGGAEDFAFISRAVPSLMLALSAGNSPEPLHHPGAVFDEECIPYGVAALASLALKA